MTPEYICACCGCPVDQCESARLGEGPAIPVPVFNKDEFWGRVDKVFPDGMPSCGMTDAKRFNTAGEGEDTETEYLK